MNSIVPSSLIPVGLLIAIGFIAEYAGYIRAEATKYLATLVFTVLLPALIMLTLATVMLELVGATLASARVGAQLKGALGLALLKNLVMPAIVAALGWAVGLTGLPLTVMIVSASLPIGANVFMFSQRYEVAQELVTAGVAVSTVLGVVTISLVMGLVARV